MIRDLPALRVTLRKNTIYHGNDTSVVLIFSEFESVMSISVLTFSSIKQEPWPPKWEEDFGFAAANYPIIATEIGLKSWDGYELTEMGKYFKKAMSGK